MTDRRISEVAVIIVNYGTADLSIKAVESVLEKDHGARHVRVYLVDNASPSDDAERFEEVHAAAGWGSRVILLPERKNHGFGRGNNVVLEQLVAQPHCDAVFLLNPDARLENDVINLLADALEKDPDAGAVGAGILNADLQPVSSAFRFPGPVNEVVGTINLSFLNGLFQSRLVALPPKYPEGPVDWVSGACVMMRMQALREVGFFDPDFFLYYEEVDLMRRLKAAGWSVLYIPQARVVHEEAAATGYCVVQGERKRSPAYIYQSWRHYFSKSYGRFGALLIALSMWPASLLNIFHRRLRGHGPKVPLHFFSDHWRYVIWPLLSGSKSK